MFENHVARQVGSVIHRLIAAAVRDDLDPQEATELVRRAWTETPLGGTTAWQARARAGLAVSVYLRRLRPAGWELLGAEVDLGGATADLVYGRRQGEALTDVFVDEIKSGRRPLEAPELADQVGRLADGGRRRWGARFAGVRVAELAHASRARFWESDGAALRPVDGPRLDNGEVAR